MCLMAVHIVLFAAQVVAFVKGTRTEPQCGFSHRVLTLLNEARIDYEVEARTCFQHHELTDACGPLNVHLECTCTHTSESGCSSRCPS
jgi:hypothetical protein